MHGYTRFWGLQEGLFGNPVGFPYQILGYFESRRAKNLVFVSKTRFLGVRRVRGALLGVLGRSQKSSRFLSTKSGRFCVCCVNTHISTLHFLCMHKKCKKWKCAKCARKIQSFTLLKVENFAISANFLVSMGAVFCCFIYCQKWGYFGVSKSGRFWALEIGSISRGLKTWFFGVEKTRFFEGSFSSTF